LHVCTKFILFYTPFQLIFIFTSFRTIYVLLLYIFFINFLLLQPTKMIKCIFLRCQICFHNTEYYYCNVKMTVVYFYISQVFMLIMEIIIPYKDLFLFISSKFFEDSIVNIYILITLRSFFAFVDARVLYTYYDFAIPLLLYMRIYYIHCNTHSYNFCNAFFFIYIYK
jgi:hypothetical protein